MPDHDDNGAHYPAHLLRPHHEDGRYYLTDPDGVTHEVPATAYVAARILARLHDRGIHVIGDDG